MPNLLGVRFQTWKPLARESATDATIIGFFVIATIAWSAIGGKDLNWDQFNYHFYIAYNFLGGRLDHDFMAANVQSYLNPLPYVPFYWMVVNDWPSLLIGSLLAGAHSLNIVFAYLICRLALGCFSVARTTALAGATLAFLSPVFLFEVGTSFADITTSSLVLFGIWLALRSDREPGWCDRALLAGIFIGSAIGLKLSNVIFAPACAILLMFLPVSMQRRLLSLAYLAVGGLIGVILTHGYWGWQLWQEFGNPFFPMFNGVFNSPDYPAINHQHGRYLVESPLEAILLPFRMMQLRSWIHVESVAPDLRFAALTLISLLGIAVLLKQRFSKAAITLNAAGKIVPLFAFFLSAYVLWIWTSGNGRYGIALSILCGPLVAITTSLLFRGARMKYAVGILATICALQLFHLQNERLRWDTGPWTRTWYEVSIPERLTRERNLFVSLGSSSNSYIAPFISPDSAFTNPVGQVSIDLGGPGGERLQRLLAAYPNHVRLISLAPSFTVVHQGSVTASWQSSANSMLSRIGFAVDPADCLYISSAGSPGDAGMDISDPSIRRRQLITCGLIVQPRDTQDRVKRVQVRKVFDRVVKWCPRLFKPAYTVVEQTPNGWFSTYVDSDSTLRVEQGVLFLTQPHTSVDMPLGKLDDWLKGPPSHGCEAIPTRLWRVHNFS